MLNTLLKSDLWDKNILPFVFFDYFQAPGMMFSRFQLCCIWLELWCLIFFQLVKRSWNNLLSLIIGTCHATCIDKSRVLSHRMVNFVDRGALSIDQRDGNVSVKNELA